jgi:hypothetical protein
MALASANCFETWLTGEVDGRAGGRRRTKFVDSRKAP